jgi:hypothetical protein
MMTEEQRAVVEDLERYSHRAYVTPEFARECAAPFGIADDEIPWMFETVDSADPSGLWHANTEWGDDLPDGTRVRGVVVFRLIEAIHAKVFDVWLTHNWDCPAHAQLRALKSGSPAEVSKEGGATTATFADFVRHV